MERSTRAAGRLLGSSHAVVVFAMLIFAIAAIDIATRSVDPFTRAKLAAWLLSMIAATVRVVRVARRIEAAGTGFGEAERLLLQLGGFLPVAAIIPLAFV